MRKVLFILGQLTDGDVEWMIRSGRKMSVPARTTLVRQGEVPSALFIVLEGEFAVVVRDREIARIRSGEVVGEMSFVEARRPFATVLAVMNAVVLAIPRRALDERLELDTGFAARFYRAIATFLSDRLRTTVGSFGYGSAADDDAESPDEIDLDVLDHVALAGARFDRILRRLSETSV